MAITVDLLINYYAILNMLSTLWSVCLRVLDKLYSIYLLFYKKEHNILGNTFPTDEVVSNICN